MLRQCVSYVDSEIGAVLKLIILIMLIVTLIFCLRFHLYKDKIVLRKQENVFMYMRKCATHSQHGKCIYHFHV